MHNDDEFQDANGEQNNPYRQLSIPCPLILFDVILDLQLVNGVRMMICSMMKREERRRSLQVSALSIFVQSHYVAPLNFHHLLCAPMSITSLLFSSCRLLKRYHLPISIFLLLAKCTHDPSSPTSSHTGYLTILHHLPAKQCYRQAQRRERGRQGLGRG